MATRTQNFITRQYMLKRNFEIFRYRDNYLHEVALHHHDFYEVYLFVSGNVNYIIGSRNYSLMPGDVLLISPMELHQPMFGPERQPYERYVLWIDKAFLQQFALVNQDLTRCFDPTSPSHTNLIRLDSGSRQLLTYLFEQLIHEEQNGDYAADLYCSACLVQAMVLLNRLAEHASETPELGENANSVIYNVLEYINDHYHEDLSLDHLANRFFISKYHLSREFNRIVGTSVYRYIIQKRLVIAKQMLSEGIPSTAVYQHCGFGDYSNFYRAFKSEYRISPKEFVTKLREDILLGEDPGREHKNEGAVSQR